MNKRERISYLSVCSASLALAGVVRIVNSAAQKTDNTEKQNPRFI